MGRLLPFRHGQDTVSRAVLGGQDITLRRFPPPVVRMGVWVVSWTPAPAALADRACACALLPQPTRGAFDLERLHGKDVHGSFHLPPRPGVRHDEPGQGLRHRASELLRTEEHLHPLHVRRAPPTLNAATHSCPQSTNSPNTRTERKKREEGQEEG